jgi:hypothetical protein
MSTPVTIKDATYERQIRSLLQTSEPKVRRAFLAAMADVKNRAQLGLLRDALRSGDVGAAIQALNIDAASFVNIQTTVMEVYAKSGAATVTNTPWQYADGSRAVVRFNSLSPRSEEYLRTVSTRLAQGLSDEARALSREVIADGYAFNRGVDRIARDLVGRMGSSGRREGGIIGLDRQSAQWVQNMRMYLESDPKRALGMTRRDKRFDKLLTGETKLTAAQINKIVTAYENRLLMSRGLRIARTETLDAIEAGKFEAWQQGLEKTGIPDQFVIRTWKHTGRALFDRPDHQMMNGAEVRGLTFPFALPSGAFMMHPHDTSFGAGPEQIINCMCRCDYSLDKKGLKAWRVSAAQ